jgi:hypothetical protein
MPGAQELLGLVIVVFVIWILLKVTAMAIRIIVFLITIVVIFGAVYWLFMR